MMPDQATSPPPSPPANARPMMTLAQRDTTPVLPQQPRDQPQAAGEIAHATAQHHHDGDLLVGQRRDHVMEIGRASCRERVWQYVVMLVVAGSITKKNISHTRPQL